jgi:hypothetical protein
MRSAASFLKKRGMVVRVSLSTLPWSSGSNLAAMMAAGSWRGSGWEKAGLPTDVERK